MLEAFTLFLNGDLHQTIWKIFFNAKIFVNILVLHLKFTNCTSIWAVLFSRWYFDLYWALQQQRHVLVELKWVGKSSNEIHTCSFPKIVHLCWLLTPYLMYLFTQQNEILYGMLYISKKRKDVKQKSNFFIYFEFNFQL